jgi:hypothetical protein
MKVDVIIKMRLAIPTLLEGPNFKVFV